ncbi:siroheme synthase middle domains-like protein [Aureobasidium subglaciale]|nr:siroheme synthase middle domains-like protein [Aureobasidium subglaciale]KAI5230313.1 siroheme synthase middle domains-like protein [Aureobasidium subglaciale]KAI5233565.1 siroheme synthase middle domains-like protein [Aureobasidium subglaciale]KAI5241073.1 siroheme synthase middle domains-like protein [Aureobasidium subglaciale]KAI5266921.1 siroheme synthase middle domains-like protein [Aureobasidium subglaciale]
MAKFPEIEGGGSLMLAWQIRNKLVLMVGGGEVAAGRILNLLNSDAKVRLISPRSGLNDEVAHRVEQGLVEYIDRTFEPSDLDDPNIAMVMTAIDDPEASTMIWKLCKEKRIVANIADVPPECDFYFGSQYRDGPLQIMVSTSGNGPRMANIVRRRIAASLPPKMGEAIKKVGALRKKLRVVAPGNEEGPKRMKWMIKVCDKWSLEDFCTMEERDMEALLESYAPDVVPTFEQSDFGLGFSPPFALQPIHFDFAIFPSPSTNNMTSPSGVPNYDQDVDFQELALTDPDFAKFYDNANAHVDFQDPKALQQLTKSLLKRDFNLELELLDDRLCPPVPVRYSYVRWLQDLMDTTNDIDVEDLSKEEVTGLDIGIGASCIYSLLACSLRSSWKMLGTDIDPTSFTCANNNIEKNSMGSRITTKLNTSEDPLISPQAFGIDRLGFTMCNPPFYSSAEDMAISSAVFIKSLIV